MITISDRLSGNKSDLYFIISENECTEKLKGQQLSHNIRWRNDMVL